MKSKIDLNCDMGESFGNYNLGCDFDVMNEISSANIACGFHAGDFMVLDKTVKWAIEKNVAIGCHPGFPDLQGFGRRNLELSPDEVEKLCTYQLGAMYAFTKKYGGKIQHYKPQGNLYIMTYTKAMNGDTSWAEALGRAVLGFDKYLIIMSFAGAPTKDIWRNMGLRVASEVYPDREYNANMTHVSRRVPGAVIKDHHRVLERAVMMAKEHKIIAMDGTVLENVEFETMCVHGDNPETLQGLREINRAFTENGIELTPLAEIIK